ncbi:hypothetical protein Q2T40_15540 [Winogradskyella maritima]|uniref:Lipocalin-like domain-containing protein n=1 Tax=Winogradskyella maritima TaxID=1517766 RepID=A0ABV8AGP1_9FLAO|nr:hypothetical protein [Winogradskyella maritima]
MKQFIFLLIVTCLLCSCSSDDSDTGLVGRWQLTEVLVDPGDGSGTFNPVNSNKTVTFNSNGTWSSNGTMCFISTESSNGTVGTYSETGLYLQSDSCSNPDWQIPFEQNGSTLIVSYFCIEGCQEKFIKR